MGALDQTLINAIEKRQIADNKAESDKVEDDRPSKKLKIG